MLGGANTNTCNYLTDKIKNLVCVILTKQQHPYMHRQHYLLYGLLTLAVSYAQTHTCMTHMHMHIYTNGDMHMHTYIHAHIYTYIHTCIYTHIHTYTHVYTHIHTSTHITVCKCVSVRACTHTYTYTCMQAHTCIHTYTN